jgi:hypothetical protein
MRFVSVVRRAGGDAGDSFKPDGVAAEVAAGQFTRVDFSDADLAGIAGRVVDTENPVAGAAVNLSQRGVFGMPRTVRTAEDGVFEFDRLEPGSYTLEVRVPPDDRPLVSEILELSAGRRVEKELALPTGAIEGKVVDKLTHDPIEGAKIVVESLDKKQEPGFRMAVRMGGGADGFYSGRDGRFRVPFVAAGKYRVTAAKDGYGQEAIEPVQLMEAGDVASNADLQLSPGCTLAGRVVDALGETPLEGAFVQGRDADGRPLVLGSSVVADSDGRFRLAGLRPGTVSLSVFRPGYARWEGAATVRVDGEAAITIPMKKEE